MEYLVRIWAHCQGNRRGEWWAGKTAAYVEDIAGWEGGEGKLASGLAEPLDNDPGWITIEKDGIRINGWNERNAQLLANWNRNPSGKAKGKASDTPRGSQRPPLREPDRTGQDKNGEEGTRARGASPAENPEEKSAPPHIPSVQEVITEGQMPGSGVPEAYCIHFFQKHEDGSTSWFDAHGKMRPWQKRLRTWWGKDRPRPEWKKPAGKKSREDVADLEAQLQLAKDPVQIEQLRKRLEEARA